MEEKRDYEEYSIPLKDSPGLHDCPQFVYSVDDGTLPSNIRSVFLTKVQLTREYQRSRVCLETCCNRPKDTDEKTRRKRKLWLICGLVVVITAFVTAFAVWELLRKTSQNPPVQQWDMKEHASDVQEHEEERVSTQPITKTQSVGDKMNFHRTPCRKICWDFSAFKFRSKCLDGVCRCGGYGYNSDTCLPDIDGCMMQNDDVTHAQASKNGERMSLYSCKQKRLEGNAIHVFSVFGMGDSEGTVIELKGAKNDEDITLVLSSYQKVSWVVQLKDGVRIGKIIMMQTSSSGESGLVLEGLKTLENPTVMSYKRQSGYGDDRDGGHTVQLIQAITQEVGQITTFTGSKYADYFSLNLALSSTESL
ncbi:uncharacterized protein LOC110440463 [Mizuhopecten yessoensis]|uniref:Uncharacterized protein n=1 Tax=Mizuhopecten yessoensis TaxID=6573 RepID=A0A210PL12_MIZYE|nr:uncharacterized protein LOC110440463 [Mizuhopecten yessoensis]OWF37154.1 hypothetical protein KP79_PYT21328 [Mizuhopecten yessoensis]